MKVGTDSILLGKWIEPLPSDRQMLDIGTGTGIIALMVAEKTASANYTINAIDIDDLSVEEAQFNFDASQWKDCLKAERISLQEFTQKTAMKFDLIFTNPPFFVNSLKAPDARRNSARHTDSLPFRAIIDSAFALLSPGGRLDIILPPEQAKEFKNMAELYHIGKGGEFQLRMNRLEKVRTSPDKPVKRWLMEFILEGIY